MRVLIVICTPDGRHGALASKLTAVVREAIGNFKPHHERIDVDVRAHTELDDLTPARNAPIDRSNAEQFARIKRFDCLDLIWIYGTPDFYPWAESAHPARWFVRACLLTRKCVFAWGGALQLVAYVLGTGGDVSATAMRAVNGAPLSQLPTPGEGLAATQLVLDSHTGDVLAWDGRARVWRAVHDAGSHLDSGHPTAPYRRVDERSDAVKDTHMARARGARQIHASVHPQAVLESVLLRGQPSNTLLMQTANRWACHLKTRQECGPFGSLRALLTHPQGVQAFEIGNCAAFQGELEAAYPTSTKLARAFAARAYGLLSAMREGEVQSALAERAPIPLAYVVGQPTLDQLPTRMLDVIAALAPESDSARMVYRAPAAPASASASACGDEERAEVAALAQPRLAHGASADSSSLDQRSALSVGSRLTRASVLSDGEWPAAGAAGGGRAQEAGVRSQRASHDGRPWGGGGRDWRETRPPPVSSAHSDKPPLAPSAPASPLSSRATGRAQRPLSAYARPQAHGGAQPRTRVVESTATVASGPSSGGLVARPASAHPRPRQVSSSGQAPADLVIAGPRSPGRSSDGGRWAASGGPTRTLPTRRHTTDAWGDEAARTAGAVDALGAQANSRVVLQPHGTGTPYSSFKTHQALASKPHARDVYVSAHELRLRDDTLARSLSIHKRPFVPNSSVTAFIPPSLTGARSFAATLAAR